MDQPQIGCSHHDHHLTTSLSSHQHVSDPSLLNHMFVGLLETCPWLIIGLVVATLFQLFLQISPDFIQSYLTKQIPSHSPKGHNQNHSFPQPSTGTNSIAAASTATITNDNTETFLHMAWRIGSTNISAALLGIFVPLCSCGILPFASVLLDNQSIPPYAVLAFALAVMAGGVDSIAMTMGVLGVRATLVSLLITVFLAAFSGTVVATVTASSSDRKDEQKSENDSTKTRDSAHGHTNSSDPREHHDCTCESASDDTNSLAFHSHSSASNSSSQVQKLPHLPLKFLHSILDNFQQLFPYLVASTIINALCTLYLREPAGKLTHFIYIHLREYFYHDSNNLSIAPVLMITFQIAFRFLVLLATVPLQLCEHGAVAFTRALQDMFVIAPATTSSSTLSQAHASGSISFLTNGTAFSMLIFTPAMNMAILGFILRKKIVKSVGQVVMLLMAMIASMVGASFVLDRIFERSVGVLDSLASTHSGLVHLPRWFEYTSLALFTILAVISTVDFVGKYFSTSGSGSHQATGKNKKD